MHVLEDDPAFDAGTGSVLNAAGCIEMDALICDGTTLKSGAVMGIDNVRHPVSVARALMDTTSHAVIAGEGAKKFAARCQEPVDPSVLVTEEALRDWDAMKDYTHTVRASFRNAKVAPADMAAKASEDSNSHDTVGAVALDADGNIAAATSTGGITRKLVGRVGDSPLVGCGGYADSAVGGASTTGHGESIIRVMLARTAVDALTQPRNDAFAYACRARSAAARAVAHMRARVDGYGGVIVVAPDGSVGVAHSTARMAWAACTGRVGDVADVAVASVHAASDAAAGGEEVDGIASFGVAPADTDRSAM